MKRITMILAIVSAIGLATSAHAAGCTGNCGTDGADGVVTLSPSGNSSYQYITTSGGIGGAGELATAGGTNGSSYTSNAFSATAGENLQFFFNYVTSDGAGFADYAFAELITTGGTPVATLFTARTTPTGDTSPGFGLPADDATLTPSATPIIPGAPVWSPLAGSSGTCFDVGCGYTGWIQANYTVATPGDYEIELGVSNYDDTEFDSGLAFDQITAGGVVVGGALPEPATWAMMLAGFGMIGYVMRTRLNVRAAIAFT